MFNVLGRPKGLAHFAAASTIAIVAGIGSAHAQEQQVAFNIPAQSLSSALLEFSRQSNVMVGVDPALVNGKQAPALQGSFTPSDALTRLLAGSGLSAAPRPEGGYAVQDPASPTRLGDASGAAPSEDGATAEVLVIGSRSQNIDIRRSEDDPQAYVVFTGDQIQMSGSANLEEFFQRHLTTSTQNSTNSQHYQGSVLDGGTTSAINLRGLGTDQTLILIDGHRAARVNGFDGNATLSQTDINGIPLDAIERVEVLSSSASAIYGGSASGGVINIIMKRDYHGGLVRYSLDGTADGHAFRNSVAGNYGFSSARSGTQILFGGQHSEADALRLSDRDDMLSDYIAQIRRNDPNYLNSPSTIFAGGTTNIASAPAVTFVPVGTPGAICFGSTCILFAQPNLVLRDGTPLNSNITSIPYGAGPGDNIDAALVANAGGYNFNLSSGTGPAGLRSSFGPASTISSLYGSFRQTLFSDAEIFGEASWDRNEGRMLVNPFSSFPHLISAFAPTNPFLQSVNVVIPSPLREESTSTSETYSFTLGGVAPLFFGWRGSFDYTYSRNDFDFHSADPDNQSLDADLNSGALNPFVDTLLHPLNLEPYVANSSYSGSSTLQDLNVRASGALLTLPAGAVSMTVGIGHRREAADDATLETVYGLRPADSQERVYFGRPQFTDHAYIEALIPLLAPDNHIPLVYALELQAAVRSERYTVRNGTPFVTLSPAALAAFDPPQGVETTNHYASTNPTIALKYQPFSDFTLRGSYATGFLPPRAFQLLQNSQTCFNCALITDPASNTTYFTNTIQGGNPNLSPQETRSSTFGVIWEPSSGPFNGVRINLEYYRITQPNYIVQPFAQTIVNEPSLANRVTRDPGTGAITLIDTTFLNATEYKTNGIDLRFDYVAHTDFGTLTLSTNGTLILHDRRQFAIGSPMLDYAGYPNDGGVGKARANASLRWDRGPFSVLWSTTFYSEYSQSFTSGSPFALMNGASLNT